MTSTGIRWFKFWNVAAWFSRSSRLWLESRICGKWRLKCRKLGVCTGITNLALRTAQKRFRREFGMIVDWTFPLTSHLRNSAGCVWKGKNPCRPASAQKLPNEIWAACVAPKKSRPAPWQLSVSHWTALRIVRTRSMCEGHEYPPSKTS
jgi:hypothetical protein